MAGRAVAMVPSGSFGGPEYQLEGLNSNFTGILSSRGDYGAEAIGTARGRNTRKARSKNWSKEQTRELLKACLKFEEDASTSKGRRPVRKWQIICGSVNGKSAEECEGRSETLTKSFNRIKKYCDDHYKQFDKLSTEELKRLKLASKIEPDWYDLLFKIKEQPRNTMGVSSPDSRDRSISSSSAPARVMVGFLSIAGFFFFPLSVWFLSVICRPSKSKSGVISRIKRPNQRLLRSRASQEQNGSHDSITMEEVGSGDTDAYRPPRSVCTRRTSRGSISSTRL